MKSAVGAASVSTRPGETHADTSASALAAFAGTYRSDELDSPLDVLLENGRLVLLVRPLERVPMRPAYRDGFTAAGQSIRFTRDRSGKVTGLSVFAGRVMDVRFRRER